MTATTLAPLTALLTELRPGLPVPVAQSLIVEALDECACLTLDEAWARGRQRLYGEAIRLAHNRHIGHSYERRRARECAT